MKKLVNIIRNLELMLGKKNKKIQKSETLNLAGSRRSIASNKNLQKNSIIKSSDLIFVRPRNKFCILDEKKIIGKKLKKAIKFGEQFKSINLTNKK